MVEKKQSTELKENGETPKPTCGIVMPISAIDNYSAEHWLDVKQILNDVIDSAGFVGSLVSDAEETSIIQKTIVQNVYNNDIVVCDVSGKNPNVMFELGMRLAFDKATIIIKDSITDYSFDTSPIEHLTYPRDLRFQIIVDFKEKLKNKIIATYEKSISDANYSTFLKSFGEFKVAHLESKEVSAEKFIIETLNELRKDIRRLEKTNKFESPVRRIGMEGQSIEKITFILSPNDVEVDFSVDRIVKIISDNFSKDTFKYKKYLTEEGYLLEIIFNPPIGERGVKGLLNIIYEDVGIIKWRVNS